MRSGEGWWAAANEAGERPNRRGALGEQGEERDEQAEANQQRDPAGSCHRCLEQRVEETVDRVVLISGCGLAGVLVESGRLVKVLEVVRVLRHAGAQRQKYENQGDGRDAAHGRSCCLSLPKVSNV